jgi:hypothetical protein
VPNFAAMIESGHLQRELASAGELRATTGVGSVVGSPAARAEVSGAEASAANGVGGDVSASEPVLRVPEALTPLPAVDRAMPLLAMFGDVVGRRRARYKIALLKTLQADPAGRWKIRCLQEVVHWLEPASVTELVAELKAVDVLAVQPVSGYYRLTASARVVTALLDAMTVPEVDPRSLIKFLNKAMALAQATGAGEDAVLRQFRSAVAVLRGDFEDLRRLIEDFSDRALLEAAELVRVHVDDMRDLLEEHEAFIATQRDHSQFLEVDQDALDLVARCGSLSAEIIEQLSGRADDRMRAGLRIDRADVRAFLADTDEHALASLVAGLAMPAPSVVALNAEALFAALGLSVNRVASRPPRLPAPVSPQRVAPERARDAGQRIRDELLALTDRESVADFTARDTWAASIGRHSALIDAYSRFDGLPELEHHEGIDQPGRGEVWRVSRTTIGEGA